MKDQLKEFTAEERLTIAIGMPKPGHEGDGHVIVLGMSEAGFAAMADGRTHTVVLHSVGIPVSIVISRGTSADLMGALEKTDLPILDERSKRATRQ